MNVDEALRTLKADPDDTDAWGVIALDAYQPLLAYAASLLITFRAGPAETAQDIVHDVLVAFAARWPRSNATIESSEALHAYLRVSCRNLLVDRYRNRQSAEKMLDFLTLKFSHAFKSEDELYRSIFINEIIEKMPPECAELLHLYVTEDLSPAEIAERMGARAATFYSRWYRCLQKAKQIFLQKKVGAKR